MRHDVDNGMHLDRAGDEAVIEERIAVVFVRDRQRPFFERLTGRITTGESHPLERLRWQVTERVDNPPSWDCTRLPVTTSAGVARRSRRITR